MHLDHLDYLDHLAPIGVVNLRQLVSSELWLISLNNDTKMHVAMLVLIVVDITVIFRYSASEIRGPSVCWNKTKSHLMSSATTTDNGVAYRGGISWRLKIWYCRLFRSDNLFIIVQSLFILSAPPRPYWLSFIFRVYETKHNDVKSFLEKGKILQLFGCNECDMTGCRDKNSKHFVPVIIKGCDSERLAAICWLKE